jgi:CRP/FNR family transcriptional regulator, cyclic AMP receptor protein
MTALEVLSAVDLFKDFPSHFMARLAEATQTCGFSDGEAIVKQGEPADAFYVVSRGAAEVVVAAGTPSEQVFATLGPGSFFGEMAFLDAGARTATVRARGAAECLVLTREAFQAELRHHPNEAAVLMPRLARRLRAIEG